MIYKKLPSGTYIHIYTQTQTQISRHSNTEDFQIKYLKYGRGALETVQRHILFD